MRPVKLTISMLLLAAALTGCETREPARRAPSSVEVVIPDPEPQAQQEMPAAAPDRSEPKPTRPGTPPPLPP
ncbi:MAG: hypothetical protein ABJL57_07880, partial [Hyphomonas sp.]